MLALKKIAVAEVAGSDLNLVAVAQGLRGFELIHHATLKDFAGRDSLALRPAMDEFFRRGGVDRGHAVGVLPRSEVVLRSLQFPQAVLENLPNIMEYQVENFQPLDRSELAFNYSVFHAKGNPKVDVVLSMTPRNRVEHWRALLTSLGLAPRALVVGSHGLARVMQWRKTVAVRENNFLLRVGGDDFEWLANLQGRLVRSLRFSQQAGVSRSSQWIREFHRLCADLHIELKDIHNIFLAGNEPDKSLTELRAEGNNLPLRVVRQPAALQGSLSHADFSRLAVAVGVAMQSLSRGETLPNLLSSSAATPQPRWRWTPTYALCGVAMLLIAAMMIRPYVQEYRFLGQLDAELVRLRPQVRQVEHLSTETDALQQKAQTLANLKGTDARNLEALREISEVLPDTSWLNEFTLRGDTVEISGIADSASALVQSLGQSQLFREVTLTSGIMRNQQGKEMFRIRAKMQF
ncbi:MAG: PilN domain-containing protein [Acidobacteriia bacterium]|nr:PilN domain-containing protein [Terriglobia bacterium]